MTRTDFRSIEEKTRGGFTHKFVIDHADLTEATDNTTQAIALLTVPAFHMVKCAATYLKTPFQKTGTAGYNSNTVIVGDAGDTARFIASQQINVNGTEILAQGPAQSKVPHAYATATAVNATFASMASYDLAELDAGELHIFLEIVPLDTLN
jgi:hypothetical protein